MCYYKLKFAWFWNSISCHVRPMTNANRWRLIVTCIASNPCQLFHHPASHCPRNVFEWCQAVSLKCQQALEGPMLKCFWLDNCFIICRFKCIEKKHFFQFQNPPFLFEPILWVRHKDTQKCFSCAVGQVLLESAWWPGVRLHFIFQLCTARLRARDVLSLLHSKLTYVNLVGAVKVSRWGMLFVKFVFPWACRACCKIESWKTCDIWLSENSWFTLFYPVALLKWFKVEKR